MDNQDFANKRAALRQQMQDLNKQERQHSAAKNRAEIQASLTPDQLAAQAKTDALITTVFDNANGVEYLSYLATVRPVMHDEIQEAITRHKGIASAASKPATG